MSVTFYYSPHSSASPVHWTLEELGIPYEKVLLDFRAGDTKKPEFLKLNPNAKVPVLVHDGVAIFESAAIQIYLGETFGVSKGLYPAPGPQRGEVMKWIVWTNVTLGEALSRVGRNLGQWAPEEERNVKAGLRAKQDIAELLQILDAHLQGRNYLVGESVTVADLHMSSWMEYVRMMQIDLAPYQNVLPWISRCTSRPTFAAAP